MTCQRGCCRQAPLTMAIQQDRQMPQRIEAALATSHFGSSRCSRMARPTQAAASLNNEEPFLVVAGAEQDADVGHAQGVELLFDAGVEAFVEVTGLQTPQLH